MSTYSNDGNHAPLFWDTRKLRDGIATYLERYPRSYLIDLLAEFGLDSDLRARNILDTRNIGAPKSED